MPAGSSASVDLRLRRRQAPAISLSGVSLPPTPSAARSRTRSGRCPTARGTAPTWVAPSPWALHLHRRSGASRQRNTAARRARSCTSTRNGKVLSEAPAASAESEDTAQCPNYPAIPARRRAQIRTAIQVRTDLKRMVVSDYAEPRNIVLDPVKRRTTSSSAARARLRHQQGERPDAGVVSTMPNGPRQRAQPGHEEPTGIMETTVTNAPTHKGAFRRVDVLVASSTTHPTSPTRAGVA